MKRLHSLFCSPAYSVLDKAGLLRKSRLTVDGQEARRAL
jgi:phosphate:Na+ symporter